MMRKILAAFLMAAMLIVAAPVSAAPSGPSVVGTVPAPPFYLEDDGGDVTVGVGNLVYEIYTDYSIVKDIDGSVLVYNDQLVLEYQQGPQWKQRGIPTGLTYSVSDDLIEVTRHFDDYNGTTYDLVYSFTPLGPVKITVYLHSGQTDDYRLTWRLAGITDAEYEYEANRVTFSRLAFDWMDVATTFGDITEYVIDTHSQGRKADIYFNIGVVAAGEDLVLDPEVVDLDISVAALQFPGWRKIFVENTRHWVFYTDGTNWGWSSSTDGSTWEAFTSISAETSAYQYDLAFDGTYIHYAHINGAGDIVYRQGTLDADGDITWTAAEDTVLDAENYSHLNIAVDSSGYPWITYFNSSQDRVYATRSSTKDGTWTDDTDFPHQLATGNNGQGKYIVPLAGQDMFVVTLRGAFNDMEGFHWDYGTTTWAAKETIDSDDPESWTGAAVISSIANDEVYMTILRDNEDIYFYERASGGGWTGVLVVAQAETTIRPSIAFTNSDMDGDDVRIVWDNKGIDDNIYYYIDKVDGTWDVGGAAELYDITDVSADYDSISWYSLCTYYSAANDIWSWAGVVHDSVTGDYDILYEYEGSLVSAPTVTSAAATNITDTTATLNGEITATGGENATNRGFEWDIDSGAPYANSWDAAGSFGTGVFSHGVTGLPDNDTIYWRAYATNTGGTGYSAERNFNTPLSLPLAPTAFTITQTGTNSADLDWVKGTDATTTVIRGKAGSPPTSVTDGYEVYNGAGVTQSLTGLSLEQDTYFYKAWSNNATGYSAAEAQVNLGGESVLLIGLFGFAIVAMGMATWKRNMLMAVLAMALWMFAGAYAYGLSSSATDFYGLFSFFAMGMVFASGVEIIMFRGQKDPVFAGDSDTRDYDKDREDIDEHRRLRNKRRRPAMSPEKQRLIQLRTQERRVSRANKKIFDERD